MLGRKGQDLVCEGNQYFSEKCGIGFMVMLNGAKLLQCGLEMLCACSGAGITNIQQSAGSAKCCWKMAICTLWKKRR